MARKTTARDVAEAAGVSTATVDRVLNNRGGVAAEKERRVLEWARKLQIDRAIERRASRTLRIAVLVQTPDNPYHAAIQKGFEAANRLHAQFNLQFRICHLDPGKPAATARLIATVAPDSDGLVIISPHSERVAEALGGVAESGRPVVTMATDVRGPYPHYYIGPDNRQAGRVAGDLMGRLIGRAGGEIVIIAGMLSMIGHEEREMGFRAVLRERYPLCRVAAVLESHEQASRAGDLVFDMLKKNPEIRGIYNASAGAQTVVDAMKSLGKRGEIVFITHELTEDRRRLLREGAIDAVIDQLPSLEVQTAVETLASHFGRRDAALPALVTPVHIHMIENC